jgi:hypothetical protein
MLMLLPPELTVPRVPLVLASAVVPTQAHPTVEMATQAHMLMELERDEGHCWSYLKTYGTR